MNRPQREDTMNETTMNIDGLDCYIQETTALEAWFAMHGFRRVLCSDSPPPARTGRLVFIACLPMEPKEADFIREMSATGEMPPVEAFLEISGVVGVTDFEVVEKTDLPGWDGTPNPTVLSNPRWYIDGKLVPVPPDLIVPDEPYADDPHATDARQHRSRRSGRRSRRSR